MEYNIYDEKSAPEDAQETLAQAKEKYGFVPNLLGTMANAPTLLKGYVALNELFSKTSLSPTEQQVVLLTVSRENECAYCVAAHSKIAAMHKLPDDVITALRDDKTLPDIKLEALSTFTQLVVVSKGWPKDEEVTSFLKAGFNPQQVLEVVLGVGLKILSNYTNHISRVVLDSAFSETVWESGKKTAA